MVGMDAARTVARRAAWTMTSTEAQIISRIVREGSEKPPMVIMDSMRESASRGELACSVPIEPSWPGIHGLQQVERLGSAHFADDDPLRAHAQAVLHQVAHGDLALALDIGADGFPAGPRAAAGAAIRRRPRR